jgi:hypothetical protein
VELVHEPAHAGQPHPEPAGRRGSALQRDVDVTDARALVERNDLDPRAA